ncbi:MAG: UDP-N-acetylmuramyl-tripeptide synthetase, partial [Coxiellaceae bacterium]|nr:UDP-N-acetylmuramyl-tripeptide synthetase [Coxiellaceae bacterium]
SIAMTKLLQNKRGMNAKISTPWGDGELTTKLLGQFNISNCLATLAVMHIMGVSLDLALPILARLDTVPGRMQCIRGRGQPLVVVDYAHTPDALEHALLALREHTPGKLWCVFGCGGGRDKGKRAKMGQIAERYSDQLIITNDNPRQEAPESIVADIVKGLLCGWAAEIELDRGAAIAHAITCADAADIILIAGKGHEQYQQIGDQRIPFSDVEHVKAQMNHVQ